MRFEQALELMKQGKKVKLPSWGGYWEYEKAADYEGSVDRIWMHTKDGNVLEIRETERLLYTIENILSDEWIVADEENTPILGGVATFGFGEAIKYLQRGFKVARKGWNGKGMYLFYVPGKDYHICNMNLACMAAGVDEYAEWRDELPKPDYLPYIALKTADNKCVPWFASQADMLSDDWCFVEDKNN